MKVLLLTVMISMASLAQQVASVEKRFDVALPNSTDVVSMAISPDGNKVVYVATTEGRSRLWLRDLSTNSARPLKGTEDVLRPFPFWSPDSKSVGFFSGADIHRIDIETDKQQVVWVNSTGVAAGAGGTWNKDHTIVFSFGAIRKIPDTGGTMSSVTELAPPRQQQHVFPSFLPDGRHFLYYVVGNAAGSGVYVGQIDGSPGVKLVSADSAAVYATSGQILFVRQGKLLAQDFDPVTLSVSGDPFQVSESVSVGDHVAAVFVSSVGHVVYRTGGSSTQFAWFDRSGKNLGTVGGPTTVRGLALSRDARQIAFGRDVDGNVDVWLLDVGSGAFTRITTSPGYDAEPVWSPDARRIVFASARNSGSELFEKRYPFDGLESLLLPTRLPSVAPVDWSTDGSYLLVRQAPYTFLAIRADGLAVSPIATGSRDSTINHPEFSPDGKWLAFSSNRSGRVEIHIAPFSPGSTFQPSAPVSSNGGAWPRWARDGKELFYVAPDGMLMAIPFDTTTGQTKPPSPLFVPPMFSSVESPFPPQYLVASDGRFLVVTAAVVESPIHVIANLQSKR